MSVLGRRRGGRAMPPPRAPATPCARLDPLPSLLPFQVEAAYDALLMRSMQRRLAGGVADSSVRFADVRAAPRAARGPSARGGGGGGGGSPSRRSPATAAAPSFAGVRLAPAPTPLLAKQAATFGGLALWALAQALLEPPAVAAGEVAGLQTALALGASLWFLRDGKRLAFGTAAAASFAGLAVGAALGGATNAWLRVDLVPLAGFSSPGVLAAECCILTLFAVAALVDD